MIDAMVDFLLQISQASWVFIVGVVFASLAYLLQNFTLKPYMKYKATVGDIRSALRLYANILGSSSAERKEEARNVYRQLSCDLDVAYSSIGCKWLLRPDLPKNSNVEEAASALIGISNTVEDSGNSAHKDLRGYSNTVKKALKISKGKDNS